MGFRRRQRRPRVVHAWAPTIEQGRRELATQGWWKIPPEVVAECQACLDGQIQLRTRQLASRALGEAAESLGLVLDPDAWIVRDPAWRAPEAQHPALPLGEYEDSPG